MKIHTLLARPSRYGVTMPPSIRCLYYEHKWEVVVVRVRDGSVAEE